MKSTTPRSQVIALIVKQARLIGSDEIIAYDEILRRANNWIGEPREYVHISTDAQLERLVAEAKRKFADPAFLPEHPVADVADLDPVAAADLAADQEREVALEEVADHLYRESVGPRDVDGNETPAVSQAAQLEAKILDETIGADDTFALADAAREIDAGVRFQSMTNGLTDGTRYQFGDGSTILVDHSDSIRPIVKDPPPPAPENGGGSQAAQLAEKIVGREIGFAETTALADAAREIDPTVKLESITDALEDATRYTFADGSEALIDHINAGATLIKGANAVEWIDPAFAQLAGITEDGDPVTVAEAEAGLIDHDAIAPALVTCPDCGGHGEFSVENSDDGSISSYDCERCGGSGELDANDLDKSVAEMIAEVAIAHSLRPTEKQETEIYKIAKTTDPTVQIRTPDAGVTRYTFLDGSRLEVDTWERRIVATHADGGVRVVYQDPPALRVADELIETEIDLYDQAAVTTIAKLRDPEVRGYAFGSARGFKFANGDDLRVNLDVMPQRLELRLATDETFRYMTPRPLAIRLVSIVQEREVEQTERYTIAEIAAAECYDPDIQHFDETGATYYTFRDGSRLVAGHYSGDVISASDTIDGPFYSVTFQHEARRAFEAIPEDKRSPMREPFVERAVQMIDTTARKSIRPQGTLYLFSDGSRLLSDRRSNSFAVGSDAPTLREFQSNPSFDWFTTLAQRFAVAVKQQPRTSPPLLALEIDKAAEIVTQGDRAFYRFSDESRIATVGGEVVETLEALEPPAPRYQLAGVAKLFATALITHSGPDLTGIRPETIEANALEFNPEARVRRSGDLVLIAWGDRSRSAYYRGEQVRTLGDVRAAQGAARV